MKIRFSPLLFLCLIAVLTAAKADQRVTACDELAAYPADPNRPDGVSGAIFGSINEVDAIRACEQVLEKEPDNPRYQYQLGRSLVEARRYPEAFNFVRRAAHQGYTHAIAALGYFYLNGRGVTQDHAEALKLFEEAAQLGSALGQHNLAMSYQHGFGVWPNYAISAMLLRKAAEQGDARSLYRLALLYQSGRGVSVDHARAEELHRKSSELGLSVAQIHLGRLFLMGHIVAKDDVSAFMWFTIAAAYGNEDAPGLRDLVAVDMTRDQIDLAERKARKWLEAHPP